MPDSGINGDSVQLNSRSAVATRRTGHQSRILVVEDEAGLRKVYSKMLACHGYQVDTAGDGEAGWIALQNANQALNGYRLLITDNEMPKLSGIELIRRLRSARMRLPVILASRTLPTSMDWPRWGAILSKPFSREQLINMVHEVIRSSKNE